MSQQNKKVSTVLELSQFNSEVTKGNPSLLEEWLLYLATKNSEIVKGPCAFKDFSINGKAVELVFLLCEKMQQPLEVKYATLEIFDRFLVKHVETLRSEVEQRKHRKGESLKWKEVENRIENQLTLRVITCIQIASKLHSHYQALDPSKIKNVLKEFGYSYSLGSILNSEMRILKTLDYRVNYITPLSYVETLLEILAYNTPTIDAKRLHEVSVFLIDFMYISRNIIYQRLYNLTVGENGLITPSAQHRKEYRAVKNDYLLLATAVITASAYFINPQLTAQVANQLNLVTWVPVEDIKDFSLILVSTVVDDREP